MDSQQEWPSIGNEIHELQPKEQRTPKKMDSRDAANLRLNEGINRGLQSAKKVTFPGTGPRIMGNVQVGLERTEPPQASTYPENRHQQKEYTEENRSWNRVGNKRVRRRSRNPSKSDTEEPAFNDSDNRAPWKRRRVPKNAVVSITRIDEKLSYAKILKSTKKGVELNKLIIEGTRIRRAKWRYPCRGHRHGWSK